MNIETLQHYIDTFTREVIDSGFKRDIDDYSSSLPASQSNILALREIAEKVLASLDELYAGDLPDGLRILLPKSESPPFTNGLHRENFRKLVGDKEIVLAEFFSQLTQHLSQLQAELSKNITEISKIEKFIDPYIDQDAVRLAEANKAVVSLIFNERETISNLAKFSKTVAAWNLALPIYHQLIKSDPPEAIELVEIQNGSIDLIVNLDVDVAIDMAELFKIGFKVFAAYLSYKKMIKPIIDSFHGNKKLIAQEDEREVLLLENIGEAVREELHKQHKRAKKADKSVDGTAVEKKIEVVTNLVTSHIVRGNDLRLLALPEPKEEFDGTQTHAEDLREQSAAARLQLRQIPMESQTKLLEVYGKIIDSSDSQ
jgi:hypothetical protein